MLAAAALRSAGEAEVPAGFLFDMNTEEDDDDDEDDEEKYEEQRCKMSN